MNLKIVETDEALRDAIAIADYIAETRDLNASDRFLNAAKAAYQLLATMPNIGVPRDYNNPAFVSMRMWSVPQFRKYLIFYQATENTLIILRVLHASQNIETIFALPEGE